MPFGGVIPAVVTPFGPDGGVDANALADTAEWLLDEGCTGLVGTGTMGEAGSLSADERRLVIETLVGVAGDRAAITAGVSAGTAAAAIGFAETAAAAGARSLMLLPPLGYHGDHNEIEAFYRTVAEATGLPLMAYNNPVASGTDMRPELIARLGEIEQVVAIKECSGDARRIPELVGTTTLEVLVGGDDWALEGFCAGAVGWVSGVANVAPRECIDLYAACADGRMEEARQLYQRMLPLARLDMHPKLVQFFKAAMDQVGRPGGPCRPPRLPLTDVEQEMVDDAIRALGAGVAT